MTGREIGVAVAGASARPRASSTSRSSNPFLAWSCARWSRAVSMRHGRHCRPCGAVPAIGAACDDPAIDLVGHSYAQRDHAPLAAQALAAGKHVVIDKPFTLTVAEAEALQRAPVPPAAALGVQEPALGRRFPDPAGCSPAMRSACRCTSNPISTASGRRYRIVGATGRDPARTLVRSGSASDRPGLQLFGPPRAVFSTSRPAGWRLADDRFHALLRYDRLRVVLHATPAAAANPRFVLHGTAGS